MKRIAICGCPSDHIYCPHCGRGSRDDHVIRCHQAAIGADPDASVVERLRRDPDAARAIDVLVWEIRQGDRDTRKAAETALRDHATAAQVAAVKRHLKK